MSRELLLPETSRAALAHVVSDEHVLWTVTMLTFALDVLTTFYGFGRRLTELDPVTLVLAPTFGSVSALISPKLIVLTVAVVAWRVLPSRYRRAIPIGVAVPWGVTGLMSTQLILATVFG